MKIRGEDARSLALIAGAGAVGLLGTLAVREIMIAPMWSSFSPPPPPQPVEVEQVIVQPKAQLRRIPLTQLRRIPLPSHVGVDGDRTIRIRVRSAGATSPPVIYVDGIRVSGSLQALIRDRTSIDRVELVKGSAAKALYGTEASAGVIRIFTKDSQDSEEEPEEQRRRKRRGRR